MSEVFESAMRLLAYREHGALELCDKLKRKGFSISQAQEALEECQRLGLQSDSRFVELYIRSRLRQGFGPVKISHELKIKGIEKELISHQLQQEKDNWLLHAVQVWEKKSKGKKELSREQIQKLHIFLLYRGFTRDIITQVLRELK